MKKEFVVTSRMQCRSRRSLCREEDAQNLILHLHGYKRLKRPVTTYTTRNATRSKRIDTLLNSCTLEERCGIARSSNHVLDRCGSNREEFRPDTDHVLNFLHETDTKQEPDKACSWGEENLNCCNAIIKTLQYGS